jgi:outer membrane protein
MKIRLFLLLWLAAPALMAQGPFTLDQAIRYAQEHNREVKLAELQVRDAKAQITERRAFGIPQLNADAGYTRYFELPVTILPEEFGINPVTGQPDPNFSREVRFGVTNNIMANLTLRSMIFDPSYFVGLQAARAYKDYTAEDLSNVQREVRYRVIETFLPVLLMDEYLDNLDANIRNLQRLRAETSALYEEGFAELLDVERLELSLYSLQTERDNMTAQQEMALNGLKMTIGYPMQQPLSIQGSLAAAMRDPATLSLEGGVDYSSWPSYRVARQGLELAHLNVRLNKFGYLPSLDGFANYQYMYFGETFSDGVWANASLAGIGLKIPIFDGLLTQARVQRAIVTRENSEVQIDMLRQQIDLSVQNARKTYLQALDKLRNQERNLALAQKIYDTTMTKYREGIGSSLEINQAEQALFNAQRQQIQARYDVVMAIYQLEKATGK